jgi:hypothetical protein
MSAFEWWVAGALVHAAMAVAAILLASRSGAYFNGQRAMQGLLALLVPAVGPVVVMGMARQALAPTPKVEPGAFDPLRNPSDGG